MAARTYTMRWLTLEDIKDQLRIPHDFTEEDNTLKRYGSTAENFTLRYLQRTEAELKAMNDKDQTQVPDDIVSATLVLVEEYYKHRGTISERNMYLIDYSYDALVMPYRKGTYSSDSTDELNV